MPPPLPRENCQPVAQVGAWPWSRSSGPIGAGGHAPNSCHRHSPLLKQRLIDLLRRYQGGIAGTNSLSIQSFSFSGGRGVFKMWRTRKAIVSKRGGPVISSTSKSASALSRVEGVATGCSRSEKELEGSRRLKTSAAPSPSEWLGEATTTWAVEASLAMFRERLCDFPEESSRATCTCSFLGKGATGFFNRRMCRKPLPYSIGHNQRMVAYSNSIEFEKKTIKIKRKRKNYS